MIKLTILILFFKKRSKVRDTIFMKNGNKNFEELKII